MSVASVALKKKCPRLVQHDGQIGVGYAERVEQEFAAGEVVVEIVETRPVFFPRIGLGFLGRLAIEQWDEQALVQFGADEAEPTLQPRPLDAVARRKVRGRE